MDDTSLFMDEFNDEMILIYVCCFYGQVTEAGRGGGECCIVVKCPRSCFEVCFIWILFYE